jgi:hypothetical protein
MSGPTKPDPEATCNHHAGSGVSKRPYVKPGFRREQVFETMALACGKINATQSQCRGNRKAS